MLTHILSLAIALSAGLLLGEIIHSIFDSRGLIKDYWPIYLTLLIVLILAQALFTFIL